MANFTATEQLMLELTNRARMDPVGEAKRMGISLNQGLSRDAISTDAKQVLAGSDILLSAARSHSNWMLKTDTFSHFESGRTETATQRMALAGYDFTGAWSNGENISLVGTKGVLDLTDSIFQQHKNLFLSTSGHRQNMLGEDHREAGIAQVAGDYQGYNTSMVTQNFAATGTNVFITGVVYNDTVSNDNFFTVGEQIAKLRVATEGAADTTGAGGGYELNLDGPGKHKVTFTTASGAAATVQLTVGSTNVKVDFVNGKEIWSNTTITSLTDTIKELHALGLGRMDLLGSNGAEKFFGNDAANVIRGSGGADVMTGGGGADRFVFKLASDSTPGRRDTITDFGDGADKIDLSAVFSGGELAYRGKAAINGTNQVSFTASGNDVIVHVNLDSDLDAEMQIRLVGTTLSEMSLADIIL